MRSETGGDEHSAGPTTDGEWRASSTPLGSEALPFSIVLGVAALVVSSDQLTKAMARAALAGGDVVHLLGGIVWLDYTENSGAAFGTFRSGGIVFILVALAVCAGMLFFRRAIARSPRTVRIALGLVLGGAIGNGADRVRLGYVIDFIDLRWWPVFNLADSAIVLGIAVLVVASFGLQPARS